ncbi:MAG: hypothetical protein WAT39_20435 [Planctomycetota bacterium]
MRLSFLVAAAVLSTLPACFQFEITAQAAYAQMSIDGDLGYVQGSGANPATIQQDVKSAFGLGDDQGIPYGRLTIDTGVPVIAVSGFVLEDEGTGVLQASFGDSGLLNAGAPVRSEFTMANAKISYAFEIPIGPVSFMPGLAVDYIDLDVEIADLIGITTERVQLQAPIPLGFARLEVDLKWFSAVAEVGYLEVDVEDVNTSLLDIEALLMFHPTSLLNLFAGYRSIEFEGDGIIDNDSFATDLQISGFMVGGGLRF